MLATTLKVIHSCLFLLQLLFEHLLWSLVGLKELMNDNQHFYSVFLLFVSGPQDLFYCSTHYETGSPRLFYHALYMRQDSKTVLSHPTYYETVTLFYPEHQINHLILQLTNKSTWHHRWTLPWHEWTFLWHWWEFPDTGGHFLTFADVVCCWWHLTLIDISWH